MVVLTVVDDKMPKIGNLFRLTQIDHEGTDCMSGMVVKNVLKFCAIDFKQYVNCHKQYINCFM